MRIDCLRARFSWGDVRRVGAASVTAGTLWLIFDDESPEPTARRDWDMTVSPRGVSALWTW